MTKTQKPTIPTQKPQSQIGQLARGFLSTLLMALTATLPLAVTLFTIRGILTAFARGHVALAVGLIVFLVAVASTTVVFASRERK
jgi:hypothetical protein